MTTFNGDKKFDFKLQLEDAQKAEDKLVAILEERKFELKSESNLWHDTGNIVIEYESHNKPSGIAATEADFWVHELRTKDRETLAYLMFPTPVLRKVCNDLMDEGDNWRIGGEGKNMEMLLLRLETLFERLNDFSGPGDEVFLTRKQRKKMKSEVA